MLFRSHNAEKIFAELQDVQLDTFDWDREAKDLVPVKKNVYAFLRDDGAICVSAEEGDGAADYYGEFSGGYPTICDELEAFAKARELHWEWESPGCITLWD